MIPLNKKQIWKNWRRKHIFFIQFAQLVSQIDLKFNMIKKICRNIWRQKKWINCLIIQQIFKKNLKKQKILNFPKLTCGAKIKLINSTSKT